MMKIKMIKNIWASTFIFLFKCASTLLQNNNNTNLEREEIKTLKKSTIRKFVEIVLTKDDGSNAEKIIDAKISIDC